MSAETWWASVLNRTRTVICSGCAEKIGNGYSLRHRVSVGNTYVPFCGSCLSDLLKRFGTLQQKHLNLPPDSDDSVDPCYACGYKFGKPGEGGYRGIKDLDTPHSIFCVGFNIGDHDTTLTTLCASCCRVLLPNLSRKWILDSKRYWHLDHIPGPVFH
jgi:hypothetical protein